MTPPSGCQDPKLVHESENQKVVDYMIVWYGVVGDSRGCVLQRLSDMMKEESGSLGGERC